MKVKRMENRLPPFKTELFVNGLEDNLEETQFPLEGRFSGEIDYNVIHPIPEKYFNFGLETVNVFVQDMIKICLFITCMQR